MGQASRPVDPGPLRPGTRRWAELERAVRSGVRPQRWEHIVGVVETARRLAVRHGVDGERAALAGLLHDLARDWLPERLRAEARQARLAVDFLEQLTPELLHGPVAARWAMQEMGIDDGDVLAAVRYHTTGRPEPGRLEMVLMVADFAEPGRTHEGAEAVRRRSEQDLEGALRQVLAMRLRWLVERGLPVHPRTVAAWNWWLTRG